MNNQPKYLSKTLCALSLGTILLINAPLTLAQEVSTSQSSKEQAVKQQVINLNKSTFEQLVSLKGVGHTKAQAIIVYRQQAGGFKSVDELTKVSGIGEKIVKDNRKRLSI